jgi:sulfur carrier protein
MQIDVNGKSRDVADGQSIAGLISDLELDGRLIVIELNRQIIRHTERADIVLQPGDRVEIVHFVGGG